MSSLFINTVTQWRWLVEPVGICEKYCELEVDVFESAVLETNNHNMRDLNTFNNVFKKMYSELKVWVDKKGKLAKVINLPVIKNKWLTLK